MCFWTDDGRRDPDAGVVTPGSRNGDMSLAEARLNFTVYGASHRRYQQVVRPPRPDEYP